MAIVHKIIGAAWKRTLCAAAIALVAVCGAAAQGPNPQAPQPMVRLEAEQQRKVGDLFLADGNVDIHYQSYRLRADHVQYNSKTYTVTATGNVKFDVDTQHITADSGVFNVRSGEGRFEHARGEVTMEHRPNEAVLISPNPLVFEADEVRRLDASTYSIQHAWFTVCVPDKPAWKFFSARATLQMDRKVAMVNANFRLFRIPLIYLPYASAPAGRDLRQSGFLVPEFSDTSTKGIVLGDAYYWAPKTWMDLTLGAEYLSLRGSQQNAIFRAKPWENVTISARYFGVIDRGLPTTVINSAGVPIVQLEKQGGHSAQFELEARLHGGWRAVADFNQLSSQIFQLAFAPTFGEAVNSEVRSAAFLTNNFRGFSFDLAATSYKDFLNPQPQVAEDVSAAPEARIGSVDQAPWKGLPIYLGLDAFAGAVHRDEQNLVTDPVTGAESVVAGIVTGSAVERSEFAPRVVVPLRWGPWLGVTTSYTVRTTLYGDQLIDDTVVNTALSRITGELSIDIRPPSLARVWDTRSGKWKHTIEPEIEYGYVRGVNQFDHIIRFDEDETLTDTNDVMYSITQRLFHRDGDGQADELLSWRIAQKYYFDPTFNGALVPGTRNVFQALDSITPFAFDDEPRHFSPINSDLRIIPNNFYDAEIRLDYDTVHHKFSTAGTLLKLKPYQNFNLTLAHFSIDNATELQPLANQIRALAGYGDAQHHGWNAAVGFSYDIKQDVVQNELAQVGYNSSCCGIALEYRRLELSTIRVENQFRVALIIANLGSFGNIRKQEKIF